jgi:peptide/nickel transport system permease protein
MIPGDPVRVMAGTEADPAGLEEIRQRYGLRDPMPVQYVKWVTRVLRGDLGESIRTREPVLRLVAQKLPITLQLAAYSLLVALLIAVPVGVLAAVRRNTAWDYLASSVSLCGLSIPNFWLGIMLILLLSQWLPDSGFVCRSRTRGPTPSAC